MLEIKEATLVIGGMIELKDTPEDPCPEETVEDVRQWVHATQALFERLAQQGWAIVDGVLSRPVG